MGNSLQETPGYKNLQQFKKIERQFIAIRNFWLWGTPKREPIPLGKMQEHLEFLTSAENYDYIYDYSLYDNVCATIKRAINKTNKIQKEENVSAENIWSNISEHGFNKVVRPITVRHDKNDGELSWDVTFTR